MSNSTCESSRRNTHPARTLDSDDEKFRAVSRSVGSTYVNVNLNGCIEKESTYVNVDSIDNIKKKTGSQTRERYQFGEYDDDDTHIYYPFGPNTQGNINGNIKLKDSQEKSPYANVSSIQVCHSNTYLNTDNVYPLSAGISSELNYANLCLPGSSSESAIHQPETGNYTRIDMNATAALNRTLMDHRIQRSMPKLSPKVMKKKKSK